MPYKTHKPVPEQEMQLNNPEGDLFMPMEDPAPRSEMHKHRYDGHHSVCQFIREIYRMTDNEEIKMKCRIAISMTKSMHNKLKKYKQAEEARDGES